MLTSQHINDLKKSSEKLFDFVRTENNGNLARLLHKLGKLSQDFDQKPLLYLLKNGNDKIRYLAIKNLAKLSNPALLKIYKEILKSDSSADVRRETVSAIGRLRDKNTISFLIELLNDFDPEVVLQAIRGLLVFKKDKIVKQKLKKLKNHPNEIIKEVINK